MSTRQDAGQVSPPVNSKAELIAHIAEGAKPKADWRIGTEHEKFGFDLKTLGPLPYEGPNGIRAILNRFAAKFGWQPVIEGGNTIALNSPPGRDGGTISLEPGGQLELSGAPLETVHQTAAEIRQHLAETLSVGRDLGVGFLGLGFSPVWTRAQTPKMPKARYGIMTAYMPKVGTLGLDMMYRSCTVQTNLDFSSEADMVKKLRVSLALQPVAAALFANSPFTEGKLNGYRSFRSEVWLDTDNQRAGMLPFAFEQGMGFERYVDYALDVPMYFVFRDGRYIDASGKSFRDFLAGRLDVLPGERPMITDWADHLSTIFPEVRLKRFLEMRGADAGPASRVTEVPAFWVGLLYDQTALDAAYDMIKDWSASERQSMRNAVPKTALSTPFRKGTVRDVAAEVLKIARAGLVARDCIDEEGRDESHYLAPIEAIVRSGNTVADQLIERYQTVWGGDIRRAFAETAFTDADV